jgi:hypothetical protein
MALNALDTLLADDKQLVVLGALLLRAPRSEVAKAKLAEWLAPLDVPASAMPAPEPVANPTPAPALNNDPLPTPPRPRRDPTNGERQARFRARRDRGVFCVAIEVDRAMLRRLENRGLINGQCDRASVAAAIQVFCHA